MVHDTLSAFPRRFVFHGNAVAASVFLTKIGNVAKTVINPVTGQSSLPVIGGESVSEIPQPQILAELADVFSYGASRTHARGAFEGDFAVTTVDASVSDVRVTNRPGPEQPGDRRPVEFRARELSLSMRSRHPSEGQPAVEFAQRPQFVGLSLDGQSIEPQLNDDLMRLTRWQDLENEYRTNRKFFESCSFAQDSAKAPVAFGQPVPYTAGSYALASFVRSIRLGNVEIPGHQLAVRGFGVIYFGEILLNDRERRVTMVRVQLGCDNEGQGVFGETDPNGTYIPPRT